VTDLTKTLEVKLVDPNAHKRRKFRETRDEYRAALRDAFMSECDTQTAANDVVVEYDLSGYAKNALKQYVPQLLDEDTYDASEVHDEHPVRFTNDGLQIDHKPQNAIEWYAKIPHHDDYRLWCPVAINPEQRGWFEAIQAGDATMGEARLFDRDGEWFLHIVVHREISQPDAEPETVIGVDVGEAALASVCHRDATGAPTEPELWASEGRKVRHLRKTYFTSKRRLQSRGSDRIVDGYGDALWRRIDDIVHTVSSEVVEHAAQFDAPVLVLENLTHIRESMDYGAYMNRRLHGWGFAKLHAQIWYKAEARGIPVKTVNPRNTSKACHACGQVGHRGEQATFRCTNDDCWLTEYQADVNASINIADRYLSGESHLREHTGDDDSAEDGGRLTGPQDSQADADTQQATLGTYAS